MQGASIMNIGGARAIAREWVTEHAVHIPGFLGAYIAGSTNDLPDEAVLPVTSDVDVMVVLDSHEVSAKPGKFHYHALLLEVTYLSIDQMRAPEQVLAHYHLAASFRRPVILADPSGHLAHLEDEVGDAFSEQVWVERRCEQARKTVLTRIDSVVEGKPFEEQVMSWLFAAGGLPHVLLVAGLRNPTVRRRYEAVRSLLAEYGHELFYARLLELIDPNGITAERTMHHLVALEDAFDAASGVIVTPFFFAADVSAAARPVAINGSREMIEQGQHREALFWIVATFARCLMVLHADAPASVSARWDGAFADLLGDLGVRSFPDLRQRCEEIREVLPCVEKIALEMIEVNPDIVDDPPPGFGPGTP